MSKFDTFISYSRTDQELVEAIVNLLNAQGVSCWFDRWNLIPGEPWQPALEQGIASSKTLCAFVGNDQMGTWSETEIRTAINRQISDTADKFRVIPVLLPAATKPDELKLPEFLKANTWVDFASISDEQALHRLVCGIRGVAPSPKGNDDKQLVRSTQTKSGSDSGNWILLGDSLIQSTRVVHHSDGSWLIEVLAKDSEEDAILRQLRPGQYDRTRFVPFAHQNDGFIAEIKSVESETVSGQKQFTILFSQHEQNSSSMMDIQYNNDGKTYSPGDVATLRASRILLNDPPIPEKGSPLKRVGSQSWHIQENESMIAGHGDIQVKHCAITSVFNSSTDSTFEKLAQSRLLAVYFLKVTGVIEQILELKLEMQDISSVSVTFCGIRKRQYSNIQPTRIEVSGSVAIDE